MRVTQRSHQGNCRKISTDKHTDPRSSSALGDKPITVGAVIAAPLQTTASLLGGRALRRQTTPRPCKLPHFLQKYPSSKPQIRNNPHRKGTPCSWPSPPTQVPPGERNQSFSRNFPIQRAENSNNSPTVLWTPGCCVTSEGSEISPEGVCVAKNNHLVRSLLTQSPFWNDQLN